MNKVVLSLLFFFISTSAFSQARLVEKVERKGSEYVIPYSKYLYDNGLTLIVHEDHSDPIVHVEVTYHVGSAREEIGKSGFAHFFEHMMFQGSDHVDDEEHFKIVTEAGGEMNGSTNFDRTNYFQTVPKNQLERMLWLEADRMGFLLDAVTQQKFEVQRSTVKNERGQRYDNQPYGLVREKTGQALFPYGHPYSWSTIGYLADLDRVDVNDLKKFFLRWYGPNNATIVVSGDVTTKEVVNLVQKYFGTIPRGPEVKPMEKQVPKLDKTRYISYEDNIRFPMLAFSWPTVPKGHSDEAALDILSGLLSASKATPLQQQFVKSGKAMNAYAYNYSAELSGMFGVGIILMPGIAPADAKDSLLAIFKDFATKPIPAENVQQEILKQEVQAYRQLESVASKAHLLSYYEFLFDNPNMAGKELDMYRKVTPADVKRVLEKYIMNQPSVVLSVYPKGKPELVAAPDNFTPKLPEPTGSDPNLYGDLKYVKAKDNFDRSKMPPAGANPLPVVPEMWKHDFSGTAKAIGIQNNETPTVTAVIYFPLGHVYEPTDKAGLAKLTATMLEEGTGKLTGEEVESQLERLGSSVSFFSNNEHLGVSIYALRKNLDSTIALVQEMIYTPRFSQEDFDREKKKTIEAINNQATQPAVLANNAFFAKIYGEDQILGIPASGTIQTVERITLNDVKTFHERMLKTDPQLVVVGDISKDAVQKSFTFMNRFSGKREDIALKPVQLSETNKIYLVHRPNAAQSEIRVGKPGLPYDATGDYFRATVMNYPFGGSFNSRVNLNLREDKGYTYGARGYFTGSTYPGYYLISTGVRTDATDSSMTEIIKELRNYSEKGITEQELTFTRSSIAQSEALDYETPWKKAGFLNLIQKYNLTSDYPKEQQKILESLSSEEVNKLAASHLNPNNMVVVIVGDREQIAGPLKNQGWEIIELDEKGKPVSAPAGTEK